MLKEIPGVGARLEERLVAHYGDEDRALEALLDGNVAGLLAVKGMRQRQAVNLVQRAQGMKHGVAPADFLATDEAIRIYEGLMERLTGFAHSDYARLKIRTLFPSSRPELIERNRKLAVSAMEAAKALQGCDLDRILSRIRPLREPKPSRVRSRALAAGTVEILGVLKARGLDKAIDVQLVESVRELRDLSQGYDRVTLLGEPDSLALPEVEDAESEEEWYLVPETVLDRYAENLDVLEAALEAAGMLEAAGLCSFHLEGLEGGMAGLREGDDDESRRMASVLELLAGRVEEAVSWANSELRRKIETSSVTLAGEDLLQALGLGEDLRGLIESQMGAAFQEVLEAARDRLCQGLELTALEAAHLEEVMPSEVGYPVEEDRQALLRFQQEGRKRLEARRLEAKRELAREMADRWVQAQELVTDLLEFDVVYSLGQFALQKGLRMPQFVDEPCVGFEGGENLFLEIPQPVSYSAGKTDLVEHEERGVILSGVNSGGKTTLLELIAQVVILAHMGMPVPADACRLSLFQGIYYFGKSRGTLGAGAFEATVRKFSVVAKDSRKLVLADELEAITEPGASAKIIASLMDELARRGSVAIFVSHLAEEVQRFVETEVRIDGIEAEGLDADNNLIVNRNPVYNHLAKSTPELIIDRLLRTTSGQEQDFYSRLLQKFR